MVEIRVDENTFLVVDFKDLLAPREEEVTAWRFAGKSKSTISKIIGTSPETVSKQQRRAYEKMHVEGTDSPLPLLMMKAFQNGWAKFVVAAAVVFCVLPAPRVGNIPVARGARREVSLDG